MPLTVRTQTRAGLFAHHGFWGPGIKLMRRVQFGTKALLISMAFLIPIVILLALHLKLQQDLIAFTRAELDGVQALKAVSPLTSEIGRARTSARVSWSGLEIGADFTQAAADVDRTLADMQKALDASHDPLSLAEEFTGLKKAWDQAVQDAPTGATSGKLVFEKVNQNNTRLLELLGSRSNLLLDPDADSYFLMSAMLLDYTEFREFSGQVWSWSIYGLRKGTLSRAQAARLDGWMALADRSARHLKDDLGHAVEANPALSRLDLHAVEDAAKLMRDSYDAWSSAASGDAQKAEQLYAAGKPVLLALNTFSEAGLATLEGLLSARLESSQTERLLTVLLVSFLVALALYSFKCFYLTTSGGMLLVSRRTQPG